jgi:hypothetical protein
VVSSSSFHGKHEWHCKVSSMHMQHACHDAGDPQVRFS